jgi:hypothetical protein
LADVCGLDTRGPLSIIFFRDLWIACGLDIKVVSNLIYL